jgi:2-polyprenyl-3-methyl-5-hydroxy-6-metoxy-1,4-benzoquinol methylase
MAEHDPQLLTKGPLMPERVKRAFDFDELWRGTWGDIQSVGPVHRHLQRMLTQTIDSLGPKTVLDVGCGAGQNLAVLAEEHRYALTGMDVSLEALRRAKQRVPGASFLVMDAQTAVLNAQFDVVMSIGVLEHLLDGQSAVSRMAALARGWVLVNTIGGTIYPNDHAVGHIAAYTKESLAATLERAGLKVEWISAWGFPFYSAVRALTERTPYGPATGRIGPIRRVTARSLFHLYRVNVPGRGDVITGLARRV